MQYYKEFTLSPLLFFVGGGLVWFIALVIADLSTLYAILRSEKPVFTPLFDIDIDR